MVKKELLVFLTEDLGLVPSTHRQGGSQPSETPVAEDPIPSEGTRRVCGTQTYMEQTIHKIEF